jgi:hypothetical protein
MRMQSIFDAKKNLLNEKEDFSKKLNFFQKIIKSNLLLCEAIMS